MKKRDRMLLIVYIIIGAAAMLAGLLSDIGRYSSMLFAGGFAFSLSSFLQLVRYWYHMHPENREKYQEKLHQQQIDLKDERKVQLRHRAGYIAWAATIILCFAGAFAASLFQGNAQLVFVLFGAAAAEYVGATVIYKYLCRKM